MLVGEKIRKIRTLKGFSQDYLANKLNISQVAYSDIENNKTKISLKRLEEISTIFELDINDILTFDEKQVFNNTFNDTAKGFFNVEKVINDAFENERNLYLDQINIAEPGALVGFAGPRVVKDTTGKDLPEGFQTSEFLLEHGFLDFITLRRDLKNKVNQYLDLILNQPIR